jgi:hypothetical protein
MGYEEFLFNTSVAAVVLIASFLGALLVLRL